jgi:uncharacterized protein (TIGR02246 family)
MASECPALLLRGAARKEGITMATTQAAEREVLELEKKYWRAVQQKDVDTAARLTDDPCIVAGSRGVSRVDRKALVAMMQKAPYTLNEFEVKDAELRLLREDVAILAYKVEEKLIVDGKPVNLEAADTSVWIRRDGGWVCAMHTESLQGDSFGRDRRPES